MQTFDTSLDIVRHIVPNQPIACARPHLVREAAHWFKTHFAGETLYAVKANPSAWVLRELYEAGIRHFDVASEREMEDVAALLPEARLSYMHPVKSRHAIRRAYFEYGIRTFSLDCEAEFEKILDETLFAKDLTLIIRVAVSNRGAELPIDGKFGADAQETIALIKRLRPHIARLGLSFHPGSQCMDPHAWTVHCDTLSKLILEAGEPVDIVDVGGGFPVSYPGMEAPDMIRYAEAIHAAFEAMPLPAHAELWCEPGRALVAEGTSILTHIDLVKGDALFINDGAFGSLYDALHCNWAYPTRLLRPAPDLPSERLKAFRLFGPTCDATDILNGPFFLPEDTREGDVIELGTLGAYGTTMRTGFNGFGDISNAIAEDTPWPSFYARKAHGSVLV